MVMLIRRADSYDVIFSTHHMLLPKMRRRLIDELEYQHANAATPQNMVAEDPSNYEAYANVSSFFMLFLNEYLTRIFD